MLISAAVFGGREFSGSGRGLFDIQERVLNRAIATKRGRIFNGKYFIAPENGRRRVSSQAL